MAMHAALCSFEQARLCLVDLSTMYGHVPLRTGDLEQNVYETHSDVLGALGQKRSTLVERAALDKVIANAEQRDAAWVEYAEAIDAQLA